jgi:demethylmenaquinone methyltransferase/2-methoxy-6-polyprenyl-1,4-benzoquinol methylase
MVVSRAPIPTLREYYDTDGDRQRFVTALFDRGAPYYDRVTDWMSLGSGRLYRRRALRRAGLRPGMRMLDVGTGTGLTAASGLTIVGSTGRVVGVDPSGGMLRELRQRVPIPIVQSVGQTLPFQDGQFDLVSLGYMLRHLPDLVVGFREYHRVLRPGGRLLILEVVRPRSPAALRLVRWYLRDLVPWVTRRITRSREAELMTLYHWDTIAECVPSDVIVSELREAGFPEVNIGVELGIFVSYAAVKP